MAFAELCITSNFTFLTGGSHPAEYARKAAELGLPALAVADRNSVAGIVRAHVELRDMARDARLETGTPARVPRLLPAARAETADGIAATLLPETRTAWGRLCRLLTRGRRRAPKGDCILRVRDLLDHGRGQQLLLHPPPWPGRLPAGWLRRARQLKDRFPDRLALVMAPRYDGRDRRRFAHLAELAALLRVPAAASAQPVMHNGRRRMLVDVLTCIREGIVIDDIGRRALANNERRMRSEADMLRLFIGHEDAVHRTAEIAGRCSFSLDDLKYEYPSEVSDGEAPQARLERLARAGLAARYPGGAPGDLQGTLERELALIGKLAYAPYFLTVHDVVAFARSRGILCQGRGSAANSVTCHVLGITPVDPAGETQMVFERFVSEARDQPPDIDVDFEHERREEVIQHIYRRYGRHRAGLCATVIHYRGKRAIREVGRAMGLSDDTVSSLASQFWGWGSMREVSAARVRELGLDPGERRLRLTLRLTAELVGFPRHLSQHVGGFVMTECRLDELVPIENAAMKDRTVICWDKDDIDALGILKVDVLALGMLTCIRKSFDLIRTHVGRPYSLETLPREDPAVYDMLCEGDSIGVFQVESRAQMSFLPRMKPRRFYDLVIQTAIVRPGPIQGGMVHPYLRRRRGAEQVVLPSSALADVLGRTLGVPLFQEQAMQIAIIGAGFSAEEADRLRRAMATFRRTGQVVLFRERFIAGMLKNGYDQDFAERCFSQINGFGEYGFPESHAASFARLVYASAWLKRRHPGIFACALLNSQPMGFYAPAQIVRDAREHGVQVRPVCINRSFWDNSMEPGDGSDLALRLGCRQVKSLDRECVDRIVGERGGGYRSVDDVWRRTHAQPSQLGALAAADAFACLGLTRREALWEVHAIRGAHPLPLFGQPGEAVREPAADLPDMSEGEHVVEDYSFLRLTLRKHPVSFLRPILSPDPRQAAHDCGRVPAGSASH